MLFGGWIGDLYNSCFVGDFALLEVVHLGMVDPICVFVWTTILDLSPFPTHCWSGLNVVFSGASETLANHLLPTRLISLWVFNICYLDWLNPPSVQQTCSCFLSCMFLQFSLFPEKTHFSSASPQVFPFLFLLTSQDLT